MPRKGEVPKRKVLPDPKYTDAPADMRRRLTKFVNVVMRDGKKATAERILYEALETIHQRTQDDPMKVFKRAIENVKPAVEVKSRRVGGSTYQVPVEVLAEVDRRIDDGRPTAGRFQFSTYAAGYDQPPVTGEGRCISVDTAEASWYVPGGQANCGAASLLN